MHCLSVRQPWASLIADGAKTVELRSWSTKYRGPLVICAGVKPPEPELARWLGDSDPRGVALCLVELVDTTRAKFSDGYKSICAPRRGDFSWHLKMITQLPPIPVKGALGLFPVPSLVEKYLRDLERWGARAARQMHSYRLRALA